MRRECGKLIAADEEYRVIRDEERTRLLLAETRESGVELGFAAGLQCDQPYPERSRGVLRLSQLGLRIGEIQVQQHANRSGIRYHVVQQLQPLGPEERGRRCNASDIAAGPVQALDESGGD